MYFQFRPDIYIYKPLMDDKDEIGDQWKKHAQLSWLEPKQTFQTRFKWKGRMERLEISSRKLEIAREHFMQRGAQ